MKITKNTDKTTTLTVDDREMANIVTAMTMTLCHGNKEMCSLLGLAMAMTPTETVEGMMEDLTKKFPHLKELAAIYVEIKKSGVYGGITTAELSGINPTFIASKRETFPPNIPPPSAQN